MICVGYPECCRKDHRHEMFLSRSVVLLLFLSVYIYIYRYQRIIIIIIIHVIVRDIYTHTRVNEGTFMSARYIPTAGRAIMIKRSYDARGSRIKVGLCI